MDRCVFLHDPRLEIDSVKSDRLSVKNTRPQNTIKDVRIDLYIIKWYVYVYSMIWIRMCESILFFNHCISDHIINHFLILIPLFNLIPVFLFFNRLFTGLTCRCVMWCVGAAFNSYTWFSMSDLFVQYLICLNNDKSVSDISPPPELFGPWHAT